ncbi:anti-sigma B factor antagonist [Abditibacterium utsteinense]|uniref:Anti-sigma factor antagonist n=1 Tax=Abditibacterium utsteinense TaxID=1960156 RepID=A0A2S8SWZ5_9BACT|nr:STAS domain-containing protein [Abditibacterium utsteinense]PQV65317.1 anti-sigma B factor antagonist [Abditibacterium utsteinense]
MDLRLRVRTLGEATILEVGGEIDLHSSPQLRAALLGLNEAKKSRVVVDLSEVSFVDSTGIGALVGGLKRAREGGNSLVFCGAQARVRRVFEITGLLGAMPIFDSRDAALDALTSRDVASVGSVSGDLVSGDLKDVSRG